MVGEMMEIVIDFYDYMGKNTSQILSGWQHYRIGDKIKYGDVEYVVREVLINLDSGGVYVRAFATKP